MARKKMTFEELAAFQEKNKELLVSCEAIAWERLNFIQRKMQETNLMKMIPLDIHEAIGARGVFIACLSVLRTADILYLTGHFSQKDFDSYNFFEKKKMDELVNSVRKNMHIEASSAHFNSQKPQDNIPLQVKITLPVESFSAVQQFAVLKGYRFDVSCEAVALAERMKQTACMYEWMTSNVFKRRLSSEEGFYESQWDAGHDYETTEQICLKSLILLANGLPYEHVSQDLVNMLFTSVFNNLQHNILSMSKEAQIHEKNPVKLMQILQSTHILIQAVNHPIIPSLEQRKGILYHTLQEMNKCLKAAYKEMPDWSEYTVQWLERCTVNFVNRLPKKIKQSRLGRVSLQKGKEDISHE